MTITSDNSWNYWARYITRENETRNTLHNPSCNVLIVQRASLSLLWTSQLWWSVTADARFLCNKAAVFGEAIKGTPCIVIYLHTHTVIASAFLVPCTVRLLHLYFQRIYFFPSALTSTSHISVANSFTPLLCHLSLRLMFHRVSFLLKRSRAWNKWIYQTARSQWWIRGTCDMNRPFQRASDEEASSDRRFIYTSPSVERRTTGMGTQTGVLILNHADA
jgi:hypothetical protein